MVGIVRGHGWVWVSMWAWGEALGRRAMCKEGGYGIVGARGVVRRERGSSSKYQASRGEGLRPINRAGYRGTDCPSRDLVTVGTDCPSRDLVTVGMDCPPCDLVTVSTSCPCTIVWEEHGFGLEGGVVIKIMGAGCLCSRR